MRKRVSVEGREDVRLKVSSQSSAFLLSSRRLVCAGFGW